MKAVIPQYEFSKDDEQSIPFKLIPLQVKTAYDTSQPHRHNYYEIFIFFGEGGTHTIDFENFEIRNNSVHFVSPGQVHRVERELGTFGYVILFSREFISLQKSNHALLYDLPYLHNANFPIINLDEADNQVLKSTIDQMEAELSGSAKHNEEMIRSYLKIFLMHCDRFHKKLYPDDKNMYKSSTFRDFRIELEENFISKHKVQDYCDLLSMSEKKLNELCKNITGMKVSDLISQRILLEAKRLLLHSDQSTKEIAYYLNYTDPAHFSKFFKLKTGQSPTDFRQKG